MKTYSETEKILILGNGPSLQTDHFNLLSGTKSLGMNAAYRYWDKIGWYPNLYCCLDDQVVVSHADRIHEMVQKGQCEKFFLATDILKIYPDLAEHDDVFFLPQMRPGPVSQKQCETLGLTHRPSKFFGSDFPAKLTTGSYSVRFAAEMGFTDIGLIGIDCRYVEVIEQAKGEEGIALSITETPKHNPNYFFDDYQQAGDRYNIPNPDVHDGNLHFQSFAALKADFDKRKFPVKITNCAIKSELFVQKLFPFETVANFLNAPHLSAVFVPFVDRDVTRILSNLEQWGRQGSRPYRAAPDSPTVALHFAYNGKHSPDIEQKIGAQFNTSGLSAFFSEIKFHYSNLEGLKDLYTRNFTGERGPEGYMAGPNNQFFDIIQKFSAGLSHIHIIEADVIPLSDGWLSEIDQICRSNNSFWICGSHYRGAGDVKALWHVNGNAIYNVGAPDFQRFFKDDFLPYFYERVKKMPSLAYDIVLYDIMKSALDTSAPNKTAVAIWQKIAHRIRFSEHIVDISHPDDFQPEHLLKPAQIQEKFPGAILAHGAVKLPAPSSSKVTKRKKMTSDTQILFIDPDGKDANGHYFSYAARLQSACEADETDFAVLGRQDAQISALPDSIDFIPCFTTHSWAVGNRQDGGRPPSAAQFESELRTGLKTADLARHKTTHIYMYYGSLEHARIIRKVLGDFPTATATINLFWASFIKSFDVKYVNRFRPDVWDMYDDERITLTAPTPQTATDIERTFGVDIPVAPHPSPSFTDAQVQNLAQKPRTADKPEKTILFPGGMRTEKGFDLSCQTANLLSDTTPFKVVLRTAQASADNSAAKWKASLASEGIVCNDADMTDEAFNTFLNSADIIVCPYRASVFEKRTSGLVVDALVLGIPLVVLKGTWLGQYVETLGIGVTTEANPEAIQHAIQIIADDYAAYANSVMAARSHYLRSQSWDALVQSIKNGPPSRDSALPAATEEDEKEAIAELPPYIRAPIFLPTDRMPIEARVAGIKNIRDIYDDGDIDDVYRPALRKLKAGRNSKRCFIIGNGPSLKETDLSLLKDEVTFAMNGFFLKLPDLQWQPTYYVVEDHLVAEDRAKEINRLRGPTKLFPASLRYVIEPGENTIFFDHRPRVSYPNGFDFSFDADKNTYAGGTVTFTCMQLAAYLGFEEIYLIGVDASYSIPKDAEISGPGRVKEIDMDSDDPNHFHPDYFGKGKRWHEPNVDVMLKAYEEAHTATQARNTKIVNATVGGQLEVFPRTEFKSLFKTAAPYPRLLVIDLTRIGDASATGELKANLLKGWPTSSLAQLYQAGPGKVAYKTGQSSTLYESPLGDDAEALEAAVEAFKPDVILYRPTPKTEALHAVAMSLIGTSDIPLVTWIMDDWPTSFAKENPKGAADLAVDFRWLLKRSHVRLCISDAMSDAMGARYGVDFTAVANGVSPDEWAKAGQKKSISPFKVRYAGSLAENMTQATIRKVAEAVEELAEDGMDIVFEIKTRELWKRLSDPHFKHLKHTKFIVVDLSPEDYRKWLSEADTVVIGYNFDANSIAYTRYSLANKAPECLASGAPLLSVGPIESATIATLEKHDCGLRITENETSKISAALKRLVESEDLRTSLARHAQNIAFSKFNINSAKYRFRKQIALAAHLPAGGDATGIARCVSARVDETAVVAHMLRNRTGARHTMLDVGAHYGSSAEYFDALAWSIHCFEPDPSNRHELKKIFGNSDNVIIDPRAVSDAPAKGLNFFTSDESTGISGLHAFRETHAVTATVDATTVAEIIADRNIDAVDFLKIDVEGFDLNVLKGVPWDKIKPDVIECEFEDSKTLRLGHNWQYVAKFLQARGYAVYVSEWHPIIRYGIAHDWKRVVPFESCEMGPDAWGNFIAFKDDPGYAKVYEAFQAVMKYKNPKALQKTVPTRPANAKKCLSAAKLTKTKPATKVSDKSGQVMLQKTPDHMLTTPDKQILVNQAAPAGRKWYSEAAHRLYDVSPRLFGLLRFARRAFVHIFTRPVLLISLLVISGLLTWVLLGPELEAYRGWALVGAAGSLLAVILGYVAERAQRHAQALHIKSSLLETDIDTLRRELAKAKTKLEAASASKTEKAVARALNTKLAPRLSVIERKHSEQVEPLLQRLAHSEKTIQELRRSLAAAEDKHIAANTALSGEIKAVRAERDDLQEALDQATERQATFQSELNSILAQQNALQTSLDTGLEETNATIGAQGTKIDALTSQNATLSEKQSAVEVAAKTIEEKLEAVSATTETFEVRIDDLDKWAMYNNAAWYQTFNRQFTKHHAFLLERDWRKRLSVPMTRPLLGYMADRICRIERELDGRLATTVEDMVLRTLVASAVKGNSVDILEIGTLFGTAAAIMHDALSGKYENVHLTLLDPLEGYYHGSQADILTGQMVNEQTLRGNLARAGVKDSDVTLIKHLSTEPEAMEAASQRQYDVLVIDGDHSYAGVKTDFENYAHLVKVGGYIIFDDYGSDHWPDVKEYVDAEIGDVEFISPVGIGWRTCVYRVVKAPADAPAKPLLNGKTKQLAKAPTTQAKKS